jgi:hypothetical protein
MVRGCVLRNTEEHQKQLTHKIRPPTVAAPFYNLGTVLYTPREVS